ncbi:MAG: ABC transporter permease [Armatimonadota bacterium]|nr:ABC transporter permease [Armatimonadota bacterium]MDR7451533.1 ABC transporter permease [Armatimonadota bacterium]MDR7467500.1 ABC transporter permease [Armatimonadota bacterium]MDR7494374.1 ABC transporter permease [Armatimonadota bacterium]MDR7499191.1 ABC transporter permease [Armatimonadota bacterium]
MASLTSSRERFRHRMTTIGPIGAAILTIVAFQAINPSFLTYQGFLTCVYAMSYFLIAACGLTFVIVMGSFDFSVVSVLKLAALICALYLDRLGLWVVPLALLVSAVSGFVNGVLFARYNVPSFMATLGVSVVLEGIGLFLSRGFLHIVRDETFRALATTFFAGLPAIFYWALGVWVLSTFLALLTPFGRRVYAIGGNPVAAGLSGIDVPRQRIQVFMLSSCLAGLAGVLYMAQLGGGSMQIGADMPIPLFASVVAGGTALTGGMGGPHRTLIGTIIITWMQAGMLMLALGRDIQMVTFGLIALGMSVATIDWRRVRVVK